MNFDTQVTIESKAVEGVRFTLRRLSQMLRAQRDLKVADQYVRLAVINRKVADLVEPYRAKKDDPLPPDVAEQVVKLRAEESYLNAAYITPETLRAALVKIEGLEYDGQAATAETLLANGPDVLVNEIAAAIDEHFLLAPDQLKNSQPPITSAGPEDGRTPTTTASDASGSDSTSAATATDTSPKT